ncbi:unnamed protein product, partial [Durusdinium trenchii]
SLWSPFWHWQARQHWATPSWSSTAITSPGTSPTQLHQHQTLGHRLCRPSPSLEH